MLSDKDIVKKVRGAVLPFRCAVHLGGYASNLRFKVFNHQRAKVIEIPEIPLRRMRDERQLGFVLEKVRRLRLQTPCHKWAYART